MQRPLLEFQRAKLKFEEELQAAGDITYSIVRPTAFFKSLAGQVRLGAGVCARAGRQVGGQGVKVGKFYMHICSSGSIPKEMQLLLFQIIFEAF